MMPMKTASVVIAVMVVCLTGCASLNTVKPWEKGNLAKPEMVFDSDRVDSAFVEHIYSSKEGASGGASVGGGGCGCN